MGFSVFLDIAAMTVKPYELLQFCFYFKKWGQLFYTSGYLIYKMLFASSIEIFFSYTSTAKHEYLLFFPLCFFFSNFCLQ